jgi:uncharacterized membrane protein
MKKFFFAVTLAFLMVLAACTYDKEELVAPSDTTCTSMPAKYSTDIQPIMQSKCAISNCHNAATAAGGHILETYAQVKNAADHIMERVVIQKNMPPTGPLPTADINKIRCWINSGAPNN